MRAMLYGQFMVRREALLRRCLRTSWMFTPMEDIQDRSAVCTSLSGCIAFVGDAFGADLTPAAGRLRLIQYIGAGVDNFDPAALPVGCTLCNVYEHEIPIAEYVLMACLLFATSVEKYRRAFREGRWEGSGRADGERHRELFGSTLGLIGFGHIGRAVAVRARAFGMRVVAVTRTPAADSLLDWWGGMDRLDALLGEADFVVLACPLTDGTRGLLDERRLRTLKPTSVLINTARAEVIDETALYAALRERWFAGAALDVWYQYPGSGHDRLHGSGLPFHELDNVLATPHLSAWSEPMIERRFRMIAHNLDHLALGEPLENIVYRGSPSEPNAE